MKHMGLRTITDSRYNFVVGQAKGAANIDLNNVRWQRTSNHQPTFSSHLNGYQLLGRGVAL